MYRRLSMVLFPLLVIALVGTGLWGYKEHQDKNAVLIKAENQYQRAFHDLSYHVDQLHTELGNTLAVNSTSTDSYKKGLINVWRITTEAQNEINQLPLTLLPFNKTEELLANTSKFAYRAAVRDLSTNPLNEEELGTLNTLYEHSKEMAEQIREVQNKVIANNLRWMDVEMALATQHEQQDNTIIDGFTTVDKKVGEYSDVKFGPSTASVFQARNVSMLDGEEMTPEDVKRKAGEFLGIDPSGLEVVENGAGTEYNTYSVRGDKQGTNDGINMDFTKKGGELLWFSASRDVQEKKLDMRAARDSAAEFLDKHGYPGLTIVSYEEYNNVAHITFASFKDDIINYLEKISAKVALDNGEITSVQATDYVFDRKDRQLGKPAITAEQARKTLNPAFKPVTEPALALIRNELDEEVLCFQFTGTLNGGSYRIYINGTSGNEEKIENLDMSQSRQQ
jgi:spore germination protein